MDIQLRSPGISEMDQIRLYLAAYELDDRSLEPGQFTAAYINDLIAGFGRLRAHDDCCELCSLGVIVPLRRKGIGKAVVNELIRKCEAELYLVCIIPEYFHPFGFRITGTYPAAMQNKLDYCRQELHVPEPYVVMKHSGN